MSNGALHLDFLTFERRIHHEQVGRNSRFGTEGIEFAQALVDKIKDECKADAPNESGWCRIRDTFVVPVALDIGMTLLKMIIEKAAAEESVQFM